MKNRQELKVIATSRGLSTKGGMLLVGSILERENLQEKKILLIIGPYFSIEEALIQNCKELGFEADNIIVYDEQMSEEVVVTADFIYVTEGNTFKLKRFLQNNGLEQVIPRAVEGGACYIGASAGAMLAGMDVELASQWDALYVPMENYAGLGLINGVILPHCKPEEMDEILSVRSKAIAERFEQVYPIGDDQMLVIKR